MFGATGEGRPIRCEIAVGRRTRHISSLPFALLPVALKERWFSAKITPFEDGSQAIFFICEKLFYYVIATFRARRLLRDETLLQYIAIPQKNIQTLVFPGDSQPLQSVLRTACVSSLDKGQQWRSWWWLTRRWTRTAFRGRQQMFWQRSMTVCKNLDVREGTVLAEADNSLVGDYQGCLQAKQL